jgi:microcystin-dependent protein
MPEEPYLGELALYSFELPPSGWARCDGQLLQIAQNQNLFALLGTTYGGNGSTQFRLPDLRGRTPMHDDTGSDVLLGARPGAESHTLTLAQLPQHTHSVQASFSLADQPVPSVLAAANNLYRKASDLTPLHPGTILSVGGGQPHDNRHPYLTLNWCIALQGVFPPRN